MVPSRPNAAPAMRESARFVLEWLGRFMGPRTVVLDTDGPLIGCTPSKTLFKAPRPPPHAFREENSDRSSRVKAHLRRQVAADVDAVPPAGIEGLGVMDEGSAIEAASISTGDGGWHF